jgi:5-methylcytosine-specific restriction endonuclease McrA
MGLSNYLEHGTYEMFKQGKCRCDDCRFAQQERRRLQKLEYGRRQYAENPEKQREATRRWREKNPGHSVEKAREWNVANRERYNANMKAWRANNKDKVAQANRNTKALRRKAERCVVTAKDWSRLIDRHRGCCAYCGVKEKLTVEHVVPISRGGRHSIGNLLPVCMTCNVTKNSRLLIEWKVAS